MSTRRRKPTQHHGTKPCKHQLHGATAERTARAASGNNSGRNGYGTGGTETNARDHGGEAERKPEGKRLTRQGADGETYINGGGIGKGENQMLGIRGSLSNRAPEQKTCIEPPRKRSRRKSKINRARATRGPQFNPRNPSNQQLELSGNGTTSVPNHRESKHSHPYNECRGLACEQKVQPASDHEYPSTG